MSANFYDSILAGDVSEQEILVRQEIIKHVRLLIETWPHDADTRVALLRRQMATLDLFDHEVDE